MLTEDQKQQGGIVELHPDRGGAADIQATPFRWIDPSDIPPREWLYGTSYIRGFVTATVASGGSGKSTLVRAEALAMVTGKTLMGSDSRGQRLRVWLTNLEDPFIEVQRGIAAAALYYNLAPSDLETGLFVTSGRDTEIKIATTGKDGPKIATPVVDAVIDQTTSRRIDVMIVDPFVSSHSLPENDNAAMDAAVKQWAGVAEQANCSIHLVHHSRKQNGNAIEIDAVRGGRAFVDACRSVRLLDRMSDADATSLGVERVLTAFHLSDGKSNLAPPSTERSWFNVEGQKLPNGDNVGVAVTWKPPQAMDGVTAHHLDRVLAAFRSGKFKAHEQSREWGGFEVARILDLDVGQGSTKAQRSSEQNGNRAKVKKILNTWEQNGTIAVEKRFDESRHERPFFVVVEEVQ